MLTSFVQESGSCTSLAPCCTDVGERCGEERGGEEREGRRESRKGKGDREQGKYTCTHTYTTCPVLLQPFLGHLGCLDLSQDIPSAEVENARLH